MKIYFCALVILCSALAQTMGGQSLRIQILNGKTGKPVTGEQVVLMGKLDPASTSAGGRNLGSFLIEPDGVVTASQIDPAIRSFSAYVEWHHPCSKNIPSFSVANVFSKGIVSQNLCSTKIKRDVTPGTLILFVRDETFFEGMAH